MRNKDLELFIKQRASQIENDDRDSIDFKNGYYLATEEIKEFIEGQDALCEGGEKND